MLTFSFLPPCVNPFSLVLKILGHQKGDDLDLVLELEGLVIDVLDLGPEIDADILLDLDPKKEGIGKKKESADKKAFLKSNQKLLVVRERLYSNFLHFFHVMSLKCFITVSRIPLYEVLLICALAYTLGFAFVH